MKKTLFTNGCSWSWGGSLEEYWKTEKDRLKLVWPHHLGNLLDIDNIVNLSLSCGSNQRIVRTTLNWLLSKTPEELKNTIAIIQWTESSRYEYYVPKYDDPTENIEGRWLLNKIGIVTTPWDASENYNKNNNSFFMLNSNEKDKRVKITPNDFLYNEERLKRHTSIESVYSLAICCQTLSSLFNTFGVEYYFWEFLEGTGLLRNAPPAIKNLHKNYNWISVTNYESLFRSPIVSDKNKYDHHPSLVGHKQIAENIYKQIRNTHND